MNKQITLVAMLLFVLTGIAGCKKQDETTRPLINKISGKWMITKIETTTAGSGMVSYTGISSDYFDFRLNKEDEVEVSIGEDRFLGNYVVLVGNVLNVDLSGKLLNCVVNNITDNKFEFTGTVNGSGPLVTEKYYLSR